MSLPADALGELFVGPLASVTFVLRSAASVMVMDATGQQPDVSQVVLRVRVGLSRVRSLRLSLRPAPARRQRPTTRRSIALARGRIDLTRDGDVLRVALVGEMGSIPPELPELVRSFARRRLRLIEVDAQNVTTADHRLLHCMVLLYQAANAIDGVLIVSKTQPAVDSLMTTTGFDALLPPQ